MNFWLRKLLYSFRALPILFSVIISLLTVRLVLVFTGVIHHKDVIPMNEAEAAEKEAKPKEELKKEDSEEIQKKEEPPKQPENEKTKENNKESKKSPPKGQDNSTSNEESVNTLQDVALKDVEGDDEFSPDRIALLMKLKERNQKILDEEAKIKEKSDILKTIEHKIDEKYKELEKKRLNFEKIKNEATELEKKLSEEDEKKLQSLVKIYQSMKPKDAARIFDSLDLPVLMDVMGRMKEANAAIILANMNSERAKLVTVLLAQKKKITKS